jgi:hypothetical protein
VHGQNALPLLLISQAARTIPDPIYLPVVKFLVESQPESTRVRMKDGAVASLLEAIPRHAEDCVVEFLHETWPEAAHSEGLDDGDCCTALHWAVENASHASIEALAAPGSGSPPNSIPPQRTAAPSPGGPPPQRRPAHVPGPRPRERPDALHEACHDGLLPLHYAVKKRAGQQNGSVLGRRMARFGPRGNGLGRGGSPSTLWSSSSAAGGSQCSSSFAPSWSSTPGPRRRPRRKASMRTRCSRTSSSGSSSSGIRRRSGGRRRRTGCSSRCTTRSVTPTPFRRWSTWFRNIPSRSTSRLAAGGASALHLVVRREPPSLPLVRFLADANPDLLLTTDDSGATPLPVSNRRTMDMVRILVERQLRLRAAARRRREGRNDCGTGGAPDSELARFRQRSRRGRIPPLRRSLSVPEPSLEVVRHLVERRCPLRAAARRTRVPARARGGDA